MAVKVTYAQIYSVRRVNRSLRQLIINMALVSIKSNSSESQDQEGSSKRHPNGRETRVSILKKQELRKFKMM